MDPAAGPTDFTAIVAHLSATKPWVRLMSVLGFLSAALMIVVGLAGGAIGLVTDTAEGIAMLVVYPVIGVLYVFPSMFLYQYADRIGRFVAAPGQATLATALDSQRVFWKFVGIVSAVSIGLVVFTMLLGILAGLAIGFGVGSA